MFSVLWWDTVCYALSLERKTIELPRWQMENGTKVMILENVVSGCVHQLSSEILTNSGDYHVDTIHSSTCDVGYGCVRRFRGWTLFRKEKISDFTPEKNTAKKHGTGNGIHTEEYSRCFDLEIVMCRIDVDLSFSMRLWIINVTCALVCINPSTLVLHLGRLSGKGW